MSLSTPFSLSLPPSLPLSLSPSLPFSLSPLVNSEKVASIEVKTLTEIKEEKKHQLFRPLSLSTSTSSSSTFKLDHALPHTTEDNPTPTLTTTSTSTDTTLATSLVSTGRPTLSSAFDSQNVSLSSLSAPPLPVVRNGASNSITSFTEFTFQISPTKGLSVCV